MLLYADDVIPVLSLQLRQRVPALEIVAGGKDNGRSDFRALYHLNEQFALVYDCLALKYQVAERQSW